MESEQTSEIVQRAVGGGNKTMTHNIAPPRGLQATNADACLPDPTHTATADERAPRVRGSTTVLRRIPTTTRLPSTGLAPVLHLQIGMQVLVSPSVQLESTPTTEKKLGRQSLTQEKSPRLQ